MKKAGGDSPCSVPQMIKLPRSSSALHCMLPVPKSACLRVCLPVCLLAWAYAPPSLFAYSSSMRSSYSASRFAWSASASVTSSILLPSDDDDDDDEPVVRRFPEASYVCVALLTGSPRFCDADLTVVVPLGSVEMCWAERCPVDVC